MNLTQQFFLGYVADIKKLLAFGFLGNQGKYTYSFLLSDGAFQASISLDEEGRIAPQIIDTETKDPYLLLDSPLSSGIYLSSLREDYLKALGKIRDHCFIKAPYRSSQANRLDRKVRKSYPKITEKDGIYKMNGSSSWVFKILPETDQEILFVHSVAPIEEATVKRGKTVYGLPLDDTVSDTRLLILLQASLATMEKNSRSLSASWVFPSNPKVWPLEFNFDHQEEILWWGRKNIHVGDTVYLYSTLPDGCLLYKARVSAIPVYDKDYPGVLMMKIQRIRKYPKDRYPFSVLKKYGLTSIRGPRRIPAKLAEMLDKEGK